jgi:hypothetical protein
MNRALAPEVWPSPVFRARLDHARELYDRGIAPLIITLGGTNKDEYSEGAVGRDYLMSLGIPEAPLLPKPRAETPRNRPTALPSSPEPTICAAWSSSATAPTCFEFTKSAPPMASMYSPHPGHASPLGGGTAEAERIAHEILSYTALAASRRWRLFQHLH